MQTQINTKNLRENPKREKTTDGNEQIIHYRDGRVQNWSQSDVLQEEIRKSLQITQNALSQK